MRYSHRTTYTRWFSRRCSLANENVHKRQNAHGNILWNKLFQCATGIIHDELYVKNIVNHHTEAHRQSMSIAPTCFNTGSSSVAFTQINKHLFLHLCNSFIVAFFQVECSTYHSGIIQSHLLYLRL